MKKLFLAVAFLVSSAASAADVDLSNNPTMKAFYDNFLPNFYKSVEESTIKQGVPKEKVDVYVTALKKRIKKQDLINSTYPCLSKAPLSALETVGMNCMISWFQKEYEKNKDLLKILQ